LIILSTYFAHRSSSLLLAEYIKPSITRAIGKVMALILAAFAVAMIRTGIQNAFLGG
jgi:small neutral amino acid transporter SnatA (MarC family)